MWASRFWGDRYWARRYWAKAGALPPVSEGLSVNHQVGIGMKRTFTGEPQLGGGGAFG